MVVTGLTVLATAFVRAYLGETPEWNVMTIVGLIVLIANVICLRLLWRHRNDDINFSSVWACSRNDVIANTAVLIAAALVYFFKSQWPDLIVGIGIAVLFLNSAKSVFKEASKASF
jgi:Co/Zn/Cd efflux system component